MKPLRETNQLLDALLAGPDDLVLLEDTLQAVRRRRHAQQWRRGTATLALAVGLVLALHPWHEPVSPSVRPIQLHYRVVTTQPLPPGLLVTTSRDSVQWVASSAQGVTEFETKPTAGGFEEINDDQLLALLGSHPAMLLSQAPGRSELIMLRADDRDGFPVE